VTRLPLNAHDEKNRELEKLRHVVFLLSPDQPTNQRGPWKTAYPPTRRGPSCPQALPCAAPAVRPESRHPPNCSVAAVRVRDATHHLSSVSSLFVIPIRCWSPPRRTLVRQAESTEPTR